MTKECKNCGTISSDSSLFCKNCGEKLDTQTTPNLRKEIINNTNIKNKEKKEKKDDKTKYILAALIGIICALLLTSFFLYANPTNNENTTNHTNNQQNPVQKSPTNTNTKTPTQSTSNTLNILGGSFNTGNQVTDKTYCTVNVGTQHAGETVKISILYSSGNTVLNEGKIVPITVASDGTITVASAEGFTMYPDHALITLYYNDGNIADKLDVTMTLGPGIQTF